MRPVQASSLCANIVNSGRPFCSRFALLLHKTLKQGSPSVIDTPVLPIGSVPGVALAFALLLFAPDAWAQSDDADSADLAKKLSNPIASLISVPFQSNYDWNIGPEKGGRFLLNIQPVVPIKLDDDLTLIVRTILPVVNQEETIAGMGSHFGLGDTTQSFFFSPTSAPGGIIWGIGPAFLWPTATNNNLGSGKWGAGPTFVVLKQTEGWTAGVLANHIWSYAGKSDRSNVNSTFVQPFISYTWSNSTTLALNTETTYDWTARTWSVPLNLSFSHVYKFGKQPVQLALGGRYYPETVPFGPRWGMRFLVTFLFPG